MQHHQPAWLIIVLAGMLLLSFILAMAAGGQTPWRLVGAMALVLALTLWRQDRTTH